WRRPEIAVFLNDPDPGVVAEAVRGIYDEPIETALDRLAVLIKRKDLPDSILFRAINANYRLGKIENANPIAPLSADADVPAPLRQEALRELGEWAKPAGRDRVLGVWRPLEPRRNEVAVDALRSVLASERDQRVFLNSPDPVRQEAARVGALLGI